MKANARHHGKVTVVDLSGKITIGEGDIRLRDAVNALLDEGRKSIVLNLSGVSYMDSAGIGELVACYKRAAEKGATLKLLNPSGKVQDLLILTRLQEIFDIFRDEREALTSF
ncbi:MAG TPA: STAS domain-containing protein [Candidatus Polarisedimenticolia bacterium]|nr:STAS domain-containing protein [Candidatus Polarisedimenticolia bacterium]